MKTPVKGKDKTPLKMKNKTPLMGKDKTPVKRLTAFEVYSLQATPSDDIIIPKPASKTKIKKLKRKEKLEKLKAAAVAADITASIKKKPKEKLSVKPSKKAKSRFPSENNVPELSNGTHSNDTEVTKQRRNENKVLFPARKLPSSKNMRFIEKPVGGKNRQSNLKKKIAKVKKLVQQQQQQRKNVKRNEESPSSDECFSDLDFGSEVDMDEEDIEVLESDGLDEEDEFPDNDGLDEEDEFPDNDEGMSFSVETFTGEELDAVNSGDSRNHGKETFQWIIRPHTEKEFFSKFWEKAPLLIKRKERNYYKGLFSTQEFDKILNEQVVIYSKNLDVTSYSDGKRETHNPIGQAHAPVVWDYYNNGCSLRLLNPQTFHARVWKCLSALQEHFNSFCGANVYLTPPDTQGFAPHWDDIEAFIIQLEGKKRWKVYAPRSDDETLPDYSSPNLTQESIGKPILETVLEAGDLLYFPRGFIHQGHAVENEHSLHITLSTYQKNSWGHYLEKLLPQALQLAMTEDVEFRKGLPRNYLNYMGIVHMESETDERKAFKKKVSDLVMRMLDNAPYDATVDQRGASFIHDCLPPYLTEEDKQCSVYGGGEKWCPKKKAVVNRVELHPDTLVRLIRGNCIRLVAEEEKVHIYHCLENSREYHKEEPQFLEVAPENAPAVETLILTYPSYVPIESLPLEDETEKMTVASGLWERGLLVSAHPLDPQYDD